MTAGKMHDDEVETDVPLVRRLLARQFPQWADLPLAPVPSAGTDNALYRLGDDLTVRLPRIHWAAGLADKEYEWLPKLAPLLPLPIPVPLVKGEPAEGYPWSWSVQGWLPGGNATRDRIADMAQFARDLAGFITALHGVDPTGGPPAGPLNFSRGVPLPARDVGTRKAIASLQGVVDTGTATTAWDAALSAPMWDGPPVWLHGDLQSGNLLAVEGQLSAVIDFGCLGVGDPACDLQVAWNLLTPDARSLFRDALGVDDATWVRGRGWALSCGLGAVSHYQYTNRVLAGIGRYGIDQVLADHAAGTD